MKKTFVVLEQGCEPNYPLTVEHKQQFNTEYSDCFRLNWKADRSDEHADFFKKDICWSQGRSYLYEQVKGQYEYYIFIDDDMKFRSKLDDRVSVVLKNTLEKFKPIHGTISNNAWPATGIKPSTLPHVIKFFNGDLCVQLFNESFADQMFPTWIHGSEASMWYAQFLAHAISPEHSIYINNIQASNTRSVKHEDKIPPRDRHETLPGRYRAMWRTEELKKLWDKWVNLSPGGTFLEDGKHIISGLYTGMTSPLKGNENGVFVTKETIAALADKPDDL